MTNDTPKKRKKRKRSKRTAAPANPEAAARPLSLARMLALAAAVLAVGLYIVATRESILGAALVLAGLAGMMFFIHRYGRLGEEGGARRARRRA
jgi:hypothetical protein